MEKKFLNGSCGADESSRNEYHEARYGNKKETKMRQERISLQRLLQLPLQMWATMPESQ